MRREIAECLPEHDGTIGLDDCFELEAVTDDEKEFEDEPAGVASE